MVKTLGALLCLEALFMLVPMFTALAYHEPDFEAWLVSTAITLFAGLLGLLIGRRAERKVAEREGYAIVALVWIVYSIFGMLPYWLSGAFPTFSDCWFETMSGFTTTGATIATDVESLTHGVLLWRSLSQWMGGMGIIVLSVAILPMFGLGGMQLYAAEGNRITKHKIRELDLPEEVNIGAIVRAGEGILVNGETLILPGDHVVVFCKQQAIRQMEKFFR